MRSTPLLIALAAGGAAAQPLAPHAALDHRRTDAPPGAVYYNAATGERVISRAAPAGAPAANPTRGLPYQWTNATADPCATDPDGGGPLSVFAGVHSADEGDAQEPNAIRYWHEWFEAAPDSIIENITLQYFTQVEDPGLDGVEGHEMFLVFTENDEPGNTAGARAHSPVVLTNLPGAEDDNGDGTVDFSEGRLWTMFVDFSQGPCIDAPGPEIADTNGVYDGPPGGEVSGFQGVDTDGDGLINCGFLIGFRQPDVAEGDGLIARFPELAGQGLENPDGYDPSTFPNIQPMGTGLYAPSPNLASYIQQPGAFAEWPSDPAYTPLAREGVGASDSVAIYDATGAEEFDQINFGGFVCDDTAPPGDGRLLNPWTGAYLQLNGAVFAERSPSPCDLAEPFLILDLADIVAFIQLFQAGDFAADLNGDCIFDLSDITAFIVCILTGSP
jgi:hypothetical protein